MILGTALSRAVSFVAQLILAWLLSPTDFGVYAIAIGIGSLTGFVRDGGVRKLIVQSREPYENLAGPTYWMAFCVNLVACLLLFAAAPLAADFYARPSLRSLLWVLALFQPMGTPGSVLSAKLLRDGAFDRLSVLRAASSVVRYTAAIGFALLGFGAMSFVLPMPLVAVAEGAIGYAFTKARPWSFAPRLGRWPAMWRKCWWIVVGGASIGIYNTGIGIVIGRLVPATVVGAYFLASQAVLQVGALLSDNVNQVLFSAFSGSDAEPPARPEAVKRALGAVSLSAAAVCVPLAVGFPFVEELIWRGKWAAAVAPVQILAATYPPAVALSVGLAILQAEGHFRSWALGLFGLALGVLVASAVGAALDHSAVGVAVGVGSFSAVASLEFLARAIEGIGVGRREVARLVVKPWLAAVVVGVLAYVGVDTVVGRGSPVVSLMVAIPVCLVLLTVVCRTFLPRTVADAVRLLPNRLSTILTRGLNLAQGAS